jgi:hypothetical protein
VVIGGKGIYDWGIGVDANAASIGGNNFKFHYAVMGFALENRLVRLDRLRAVIIGLNLVLVEEVSDGGFGGITPDDRQEILFMYVTHRKDAYLPAPQDYSQLLILAFCVFFGGRRDIDRRATET